MVGNNDEELNGLSTCHRRLVAFTDCSELDKSSEDRRGELECALDCYNYSGKMFSLGYGRVESDVVVREKAEGKRYE
jgi:hypothetical protein